jgi:hypothetical protein
LIEDKILYCTGETIYCELSSGVHSWCLCPQGGCCSDKVCTKEFFLEKERKKKENISIYCYGIGYSCGQAAQ